MTTCNKPLPTATDRLPLRRSFRVDIRTQTLIATTALPAWMEKRTGERPHRSIVWRWWDRGAMSADGERIKLPTVRIGSVRYCSLEALAWWSAALAGEDGEAAAAREAVIAADDEDAATLRRAGVL